MVTSDKDGHLRKVVRLIRAVYDNLVSCVQVGEVQSSCLKIKSGVC